jgi:hypothetical protein
MAITSPVRFRDWIAASCISQLQKDSYAKDMEDNTTAFLSAGFWWETDPGTGACERAAG